LVLNNGRPLAIPWADENIPAIVEGWHLGTQSGNAIAQVLYGDYNPSGKLPMTFQGMWGRYLFTTIIKTGRPVMNEPESVFGHITLM
jgi:beta-glucosidase